jgi:flagellar biogenesis protein FliO
MPEQGAAMYHWMTGWSWFWMASMMVFWIAVLGAVVYLVVRVAQRPPGGPGS